MNARTLICIVLLLVSGNARAQGPLPSDETRSPAQSEPPGVKSERLPPIKGPTPDELGSPPVPQKQDMPEGRVPDAQAMELAGVRTTMPLRLTSEPSGAQILINEQASCQTPCILNLPPGRYKIRYHLKDYKDVETTHLLVSTEELFLHAKLGDKVPYEVAIPLLGVGAIFAVGGIYGLVNGYTNEDAPPEERQRDRNLGWASSAIGIPMVAVAVWLFFSGRDSMIIQSLAPVGSMYETAPEAEYDGSD